MKVLVFLPQNPYPCRSGAHRRMLEVLIAMRAIGAEVCIAATENVSENRWDDGARAWFRSERLCSELHVFAGARRTLAEAAIHGWNRVRRALDGGAPPALRTDLTTSAMRKWFEAIAQRYCPDTIFINYAYFAGLLPPISTGTRRVVDIHDLVTVNEAMRRALAPYVLNGAVFSANSVPEEALDLGFYTTIDGTPARGELDAYERFDAALAITEREAQIVRAHASRTDVVALPTAIEQEDVQTGHGRLALFPMGPHVFNLQGYAWFLRKVLPRIHERCPDFRLAVSGSLYPGVTLEHHSDVQILGFVPDAGTLWSMGSILVNPVFGGTGQPIKTLEGMAAGLAPVILEAFSHASPIAAGISGFVARDERDFAKACVRLWQDPVLCHEVGQAASRAIREQCGRTRFAQALARVLTGDSLSHHA